jgi:hypothetical protein
MEVITSSEASVHISITQRYIPEDDNIRNHEKAFWAPWEPAASKQLMQTAAVRGHQTSRTVAVNTMGCFAVVRLAAA